MIKKIFLFVLCIFLSIYFARELLLIILSNDFDYSIGRRAYSVLGLVVFGVNSYILLMKILKKKC